VCACVCVHFAIPVHALGRATREVYRLFFTFGICFHLTAMEQKMIMKNCVVKGTTVNKQGESDLARKNYFLVVCASACVCVCV